jgi:DNA helicase-2/ATP-dependent DNA helicase PcrA
MSLTVEQRNSVACEQNILLTACPGSGKTRTITARLVQEIEKLRGSPRRRLHHLHQRVSAGN